MIGNDRELNGNQYRALWRSRIIPISKIICPISEKKGPLRASSCPFLIIYNHDLKKVHDRRNNGRMDKLTDRFTKPLLEMLWRI